MSLQEGPWAVRGRESGRFGVPGNAPMSSKLDRLAVDRDEDAEQNAGGKPWAAVNVVVGDRDDDQQWVGVVVFGDRATSFAISKGDKVYCEGRLKLESWTSKTGEAKPGLKVAAWKIERLGEIGRNKPTVQDAQAQKADWQRPGQPKRPASPGEFRQADRRWDPVLGRMAGLSRPEVDEPQGGRHGQWLDDQDI